MLNISAHVLHLIQDCIMHTNIYTGYYDCISKWRFNALSYITVWHDVYTLAYTICRQRCIVIP